MALQAVSQSGGHSIPVHGAMLAMFSAGIAGIPPWLAIVFASIPAVFYTLQILNFIQNWKPPIVISTFSIALRNCNALWSEDKPYLAVLAMVGLAGASAFGYTVPQWAMYLLGALGLVTVHQMSKGKST